MKDRRAHPTDTAPRATCAPSLIAGRCEYVHAGSEAHRFMLHQGFVQLLQDETGGALMLPPKGWGAGSILSR